MDKKLFRKGDIAVIGIAALLAAAIFFFNSRGNEKKLAAEIRVAGEVIETVELSSLGEELIITPDTEPKVIIKAENGAIFFEDAECPDRLCVASGKLTRKGDTAVCLPAKTVITVLGADVDAVTY